MIRFCYAGQTLRNEVNEAFPDRSEESDGVIGDERHQNEVSDHNPNEHDVVTAWDVTAEDWVADFVEELRKSNDPRLKYIIYRRRIWSRDRDSEGWRYYGGPGKDPHLTHGHISFSADPKQYDRTDPWNVNDSEDSEMSPAEKALLVRIDKNLSALVAPRRPDHLDRDKAVIDLGDILNRLDLLEDQITAK